MLDPNATAPIQVIEGARIASSEYGDLVAEHQDLDVLGCVGSGEQRQPTQHAGEHQVCESKSHGERSCWAACWRLWRGRPAAKALIRGRDRVLGTHNVDGAAEGLADLHLRLADRAGGGIEVPRR